MPAHRHASDATIGDTARGLTDDGVVGSVATAERAVVAAEVGLDLLEGQLALATASVAALRTAARRAGISIALPSAPVAARPAEERELLAGMSGWVDTEHDESRTQEASQGPRIATPERAGGVPDACAETTPVDRFALAALAPSRHAELARQLDGSRAAVWDRLGEFFEALPAIVE